MFRATAAVILLLAISSHQGKLYTSRSRTKYESSLCDNLALSLTPPKKEYISLVKLITWHHANE